MLVDRAIGLLHRAHARRVLIICLGVSLSVHAAVLVLLPGLAPDSAPPKASRLQVVILQPETLPLAPSDPALEPRPLSKPEPHSAPTEAEPKTRSERSAPVLALSEPRAVEGASFTVEPARVPEPAVAVSEQQSQPGIAAMTPPGSNVTYLRNPPPPYPVAARRAGEQGMVTLRVLVTLDGLASRVVVERSSGSPHLDAAALEAVKAWRFTPARQGANSVESWMVVPIVFRLEGPS